MAGVSSVHIPGHFSDTTLGRFSTQRMETELFQISMHTCEISHIKILFNDS